MNLIQQALEKQGIIAGWRGPEPESPNIISKSYLEGDLDDGVPRLVRSLNDKGTSIKISQLKKDYKKLLESVNIENHTTEIKAKTKDIILEQYPMYKQNNMLARYNVLSTLKRTTKDQKEELKSILDAWDWINNVREVSKTARSKNIPVSDIKWPKIP